MPSVPHLEALLLLRGDSHRPWNATQIAQRLYIDDAAATAILEHLTGVGLIARGPQSNAYRYAPSAPGQAEMADRLADLHAHALVAVTNLIHGRPAHLFADAFRFRKD